tara:strand:- start:128729 stop:129289 length:561 start_codon:yes stop_codon:yes gene_type:complete
MKKDNLDELFVNLRDSFDTDEPEIGHRKRFLEKLNSPGGKIGTAKNGRAWWKPYLVAASVALVFALGGTLYNSRPTMDEKVANISPEISNTEFYFANLINEQVKKMEKESTPETKKIVDDTMAQLKMLERDYKKMEQDLLNGGNTKFILSAMIHNFQTRIDLLQDVLEQIETIKDYNNNNKDIGIL